MYAAFYQSHVFPMFEEGVEPEDFAVCNTIPFERKTGREWGNGSYPFGMGGDGHTASLFPGKQQLIDEKEKWNYPYSSFLNKAKKTLVVSELLRCESRGMKEVLKEKHPSVYPSQLLNPTEERLGWALPKWGAPCHNALQYKAVLKKHYCLSRRHISTGVYECLDNGLCFVFCTLKHAYKYDIKKDNANNSNTSDGGMLYKKQIWLSFFPEAIKCITAILFLVNSYFLDLLKNEGPPATATGKIKDATITIAYSSPSVKDVTIWGGLEGYDKVWRAGANEATLSKQIKTLRSGKKSACSVITAFFIPLKKAEPGLQIFNKEPKQWGAYKIRKAKDALRGCIVDDKRLLP
ncbi:hypothetical protein FQA39_LY18513 [Lamprigera yunnana]|nr:hypothetical protein FQA39_LY18513 [Lamprigera yunnana]